MKRLPAYISVLCAIFLAFGRLSIAQADEPKPYETLLISSEEKQLISKLLTTMAENNIFKLLLEKKRLEKIGERIHHVHPMRFLGTVFSDPRLVYCMREIRKSGFKWDGFMEGFVERMRGEHERGNVYPYVAGFAEQINRDPAEITPYVNKGDFEGLVKSLL